jgi:hypothetical protein
MCPNEIIIFSSPLCSYLQSIPVFSDAIQVGPNKMVCRRWWIVLPVAVPLPYHCRRSPLDYTNLKMESE